jgi:hypothetical protein
MFLKLIFCILFIQKTFSIQPNNFCILNKKIQKQVVCNKQQCGYDLCSNDEKSCKNLNKWYTFVYNMLMIKKVADQYEKEMEKFDQFFGFIKECKPNQYITLNKQVCSIQEICYLNKKYELRQLLKPSNLKIKPCACLSKLKFRCENNYCSDSKHTCNKANNTLTDLAYLNQINKC